MDRETAGEHEAWVVEVRREGARPERIWLDAVTFLPAKEVRTRSAEEGDVELTTTWVARREDGRTGESSGLGWLRELGLRVLDVLAFAESANASCS